MNLKTIGLRYIKPKRTRKTETGKNAHSRKIRGRDQTTLLLMFQRHNISQKMPKSRVYVCRLTGIKKWWATKLAPAKTVTHRWSALACWWRGGIERSKQLHQHGKALADWEFRGIYTASSNKLRSGNKNGDLEVTTKNAPIAPEKSFFMALCGEKVIGHLVTLWHQIHDDSGTPCLVKLRFHFYRHYNTGRFLNLMDFSTDSIVQGAWCDEGTRTRR